MYIIKIISFRFLGISNSLKVTTSIKMIEVFMLVSLVLCFNDILMQCHLELVRQRKKPAKIGVNDDMMFRLKKQAIFDVTMNPGLGVFSSGNFGTKKNPK